MAVEVAQPVYRDGKYMGNLLHDLNRERFESDSFCDATLQVEDKRFNIHKCIVGKISSFFRNLFKVEMKEKFDSFANLKGLSSKIMESVLNYIYTGSVDINENNVFDLLAASEYLLVDGLKLCCRDFLTGNVNTDNCIKYHSVGKAKKWILLEWGAAKIINDNYKEVFKQEAFRLMGKDDAINFFSCIDQSTSAFIAKDVYEGIIMWVKHDVNLRKNFLFEILKLVKLKCLPEQFLKFIKKQDLLKGNTEVMDFLNKEIDWKNLSSLNQEGSNACKNMFVVFDKTEFWLFDLFTTTWKKLPDFPIDATGACFAGYHDHLYVIGGVEDPRVIRRISLDEEDSTWDLAGRTLHDRIHSKAIVTDDMVVISGGGLSTDDFINFVETYSHVGPKVEQKELKPMNNPRFRHSMAQCSGSTYCFGDVFFNLERRNQGYNNFYEEFVERPVPNEFFERPVPVPTENPGHNRYYNELVERPVPTEKYVNQNWEVLNDLSFAACVAVAAKTEIVVLDSSKNIQLYSTKFNVCKEGTTCPIPYAGRFYDVSFLDGKVFTFGRAERKEGEEVEMEYVLAEYDVTKDTWKNTCTIPCNSETSIVAAI